jgi:RNA polymerase sigma-70 factor (ECF subfamily)
MLEQAVASLPPKHRAVFLMARQDQLSYDDIGEALRIPVGTVKSRMNTAMRLLREQLQQMDSGNP